jgi:hypothetical protein
MRAGSSVGGLRFEMRDLAPGTFASSAATEAIDQMPLLKNQERFT